MLNNVLAKVFGTSNERAVKKLLPVVAQINAFEPAMQALTDEELRAKTVEFKARIAAAIDGLTDADAIVAAEKAARYEVMFGKTHAFLPKHNGITLNTLHMMFNVTTVGVLLVLLAPVFRMP